MSRSYKILNVNDVLQLVQKDLKEGGIAMCFYNNDSDPNWAEADTNSEDMTIYTFKNIEEAVDYLKDDGLDNDITIGDQGFSQDEWNYYIFTSNEIRDSVYQALKPFL